MRGIAFSFVSPLLLLGFAALGFSRGGWHVFPILIAIVGFGLLAVALFDFPIWASFDEHGVTRRTVLRKHRLSWERIDALERAAGGAVRRKHTGPLTAVIGRRRYLLVDQAESQPEYDAIVSVVHKAGSIKLKAAAPPPETPPTWMYRKSKSSR
jgi:hypothetical protein